jgi:flagellar assembly factor FliW
MRAEAIVREEEATEIRFEEGIIGVPRARRFQLLERQGSPIRVLRCLDIEGFALPVTDPRLADAAYQPVIGPRVHEALSLVAGEPVLLLAVTTLEAGGPVANLRAPIVINVARRLAKQVILDDRHYPLRAPVRVDG